jgi:D-amino-acid oxidase
VTDSAADVVVIGAGVAGLTTAVCLAEVGLEVTIRTDRLPQQTTSAVAGAIWGPHLVESSDRVSRWAADTLAVLNGLAGGPATGIRQLSGVEATRTQHGLPDWATSLSDISPCDPAGLPPGFSAGWRYTAPVVSMPVYLNYLLGRFRDAGGELRTAPVASLADAVRETTAPVIVNCAGIGAHELVPDPSLTPVRGQVVIVDNPGITEFFVGIGDETAELVYVFPHEGRVVLGGTEMAGDWSLEPEPRTAARILRDAAAIDPRLASARVIEHRVGLRPVRPTVRLEAEPAEQTASAGGDGRGGSGLRLLVHNYGHGGGGVTLSWGCAHEVAGLIRQAAAAR